MNNEVIVAMVAITTLEIYAISQGINGVLLTSVIGILAGLAGYNMQVYNKSRRSKR